jgi:Tol biopolymer transport system component
MLARNRHISLADLSAAGVCVWPAEAVTLVRELAVQVTRGGLPGVPSAHVVRLGREGRLFVEGPVATDGRAVVRAAHLLETMLPGFDAPLRVPGTLRLVIARARGTLGLPPYPSLHEFVDALTAFSLPDTAWVVRSLYAAWATALAESEAAVTATPEAACPDQAVGDTVFSNATPIAPEPPPALPWESESQFRRSARIGDITVSDIRRARRATGLTLGEIARRSCIPVWLLRELEWGYLRNWPAGHYGRTQLTRYARAAGLDDRLVVDTLWPMLEDDARGGVAQVTVSAPEAPTESTSLARIPPVETVPVTVTRGSRTRLLAALAIPALIAIGVAPALWERSSTPATPPPAVATTRPPAAIRPAAAATPVLHIGPSATATPSVSAAVPKLAPAAPDRVNARPQRDIPEHPAYSPAFATVGSAMFFHTASDGPSALMRADIDSRGAVLRITSVVDDRAQNFHARPSPDGSLIAFDSDREGERAVYVADATGHNVRRVSGEGFAAIPSWSPNGRTLAYVRAEPDGPRVWNLWTTELDSGRARRLTSYRYGQPWGASWFPDGQRVAYSHEDRLIILDLASGKERIFNTPIKGRLVRTPAVSPDGRRVIFQVSRDGTWLLDVAEGAMRKVLSDPFAEEYTWAPDGRRVAYHSRRTGDWGVWVMAAR